MDDEISDNSRRSRSPSTESSPVSDAQEIPVVRGRGNGRRRQGGSRARGSGRGRGGRRQRPVVYGPPPPTRADLAAAAREERDTQLRERITTLTTETKDDLIRRMCEKHPQFVFDVLIGSTQEQGGYHPDPRPNDAPPLTWCRCTHCREMPSDAEKVCCNQTPQNCFSRLHDFDLVVLDEVVLVVAQRYRQDVLAAGQDNDYNRGKRHAAYRQFILWNHGYLGAGNRRVIPSCCVWKIRDKYPDNFGQYQGFVAGRLG